MQLLFFKKNFFLLLCYSFLTCTYAYALTETQVTASQYAAFLNRAASIDQDHLYDEKMGDAPETACIVRFGTPGKYFYQVIAGRENFPVTYVNFLNEKSYCSRYSFSNGGTGSFLEEDNDFNIENSLTTSLRCSRFILSVETSSNQSSMFSGAVGTAVLEEGAAQEILEIGVGLMLGVVGAHLGMGDEEHLSGTDDEISSLRISPSAYASASQDQESFSRLRERAETSRNDSERNSAIANSWSLSFQQPDSTTIIDYDKWSDACQKAHLSWQETLEARQAALEKATEHDDLLDLGRRIQTARKEIATWNAKISQIAFEKTITPTADLYHQAIELNTKAAWDNFTTAHHKSLQLLTDLIKAKKKLLTEATESNVQLSLIEDIESTEQKKSELAARLIKSPFESIPEDALLITSKEKKQPILQLNVQFKESTRKRLAKEAEVIESYFNKKPIITEVDYNELITAFRKSQEAEAKILEARQAALEEATTRQDLLVLGNNIQTARKMIAVLDHKIKLIELQKIKNHSDHLNAVASVENSTSAWSAFLDISREHLQALTSLTNAKKQFLAFSDSFDSVTYPALLHSIDSLQKEEHTLIERINFAGNQKNTLLAKAAQEASIREIDEAAAKKRLDRKFEKRDRRIRLKIEAEIEKKQLELSQQSILVESSNEEKAEKKVSAEHRRVTAKATAQAIEEKPQYAVEAEEKAIKRAFTENYLPQLESKKIVQIISSDTASLREEQELPEEDGVISDSSLIRSSITWNSFGTHIFSLSNNTKKVVYDTSVFLAQATLDVTKRILFQVWNYIPNPITEVQVYFARREALRHSNTFTQHWNEALEYTDPSDPKFHTKWQLAIASAQKTHQAWLEPAARLHDDLVIYIQKKNEVSAELVKAQHAGHLAKSDREQLLSMPQDPRSQKAKQERAIMKKKAAVSQKKADDCWHKLSEKIQTLDPDLPTSQRNKWNETITKIRDQQSLHILLPLREHANELVDIFTEKVKQVSSLNHESLAELAAATQLTTTAWQRIIDACLQFEKRGISTDKISIELEKARYEKAYTLLEEFRIRAQQKDKIAETASHSLKNLEKETTDISTLSALQNDAVLKEQERRQAWRDFIEHYNKLNDTIPEQHKDVWRDNFGTTFTHSQQAEEAFLQYEATL